MTKRNIALMVGPNSNKIISEHLSKLNDSIDLTSYDTLPTLIKVSSMRRKFFERVVFSSKVFTGNPEKDLKELSSYLYENSSSTTLVLIVKEDQKDLIKKFNKVFKSPLYAVAVIDNPTTKDLMNVVSLTVDEIKERYKETKGTQVEEPNKEEVKPVPQPTKVVEDTEPKKKQGFFSRLFGKKVKEVPNTTKVLKPVSESAFPVEENADNSIDISNLSLGAFANTHADTGYLDESEFSFNEIPNIAPTSENLDFSSNVESLFSKSEMAETPNLKPLDIGVERFESKSETKSNFTINQPVGVLVDNKKEREKLTGKYLLIGSNNLLDGVSENFEVVVDLDLVYRPIRYVVDLQRFDLTREGMKSVSINGVAYYSEGYSAPDNSFREKELPILIRKSNSILVNASLSDLDDLKGYFNLFDSIRVEDNNDMELYLDLDNEDKVSSEALAALKRLKIDTSTLNKNYLVSRRVW